MTRRWLIPTVLAISAACQFDSSSSGGDGEGSEGSGSGEDETSSADGTADSATTGPEDSDDSAEADGNTKFDLADPPDAGDGGPPPPSCKVVDDMDAIGECEIESPPDAFEPEDQWVWSDDVEKYSIVSPLVANLTDDNEDGEIDLCDVPDVIVTAGASPGGPGAQGHIYVLDGETGTLHFEIPTVVEANFTPAVGDIDGDGLPEIVASTPGGQLIAFEHDGTEIWTKAVNWGGGSGQYSAAAALADLDNDGDVEIIASNFVTDHLGNTVTNLAQPAGNWSATAAADMDDDGDLEIVLGHAVYHHDGAPMWVANGVQPGYPQIADLDDDGKPEVLVTNSNGLSLIEDDGTVTYQDLRPTGDGAGGTTWLRPAMIHDVDGDGEPEYAMSSANHFTVYEADASILWSADVSDQSGIAAGTAFDFLGQGVAQAMYADEHNFFAFDSDGSVLMSVDRSSGTLSEYPVVADIDNDGSAEVVVVSNQYYWIDAPCVRVVRDLEDRWIQARRIWNQHTYHVTNVREDGTIPQWEKPHWENLNTFRTNAQIEGGGVCIPPPPG